MSNWLSEITKLAKEDKVVKWTIRVVAIALGLFILFYFYLLGRTLYHGRTAKIASKDYSFPDSQNREKKDSTVSISSKKTRLEEAVKANPIKTLRAYKKQQVIISNKQDTIKKEPQFDLKGANISQSAIGINPTVTNNNYKVSEPVLTDKLKAYLVQSIESKKRQLDIKGNKIAIFVRSGSNVNSILKQIQDYLIGKGYMIMGGGSSTGEPFDGMGFYKGMYNNDIDIIIGNITSEYISNN